MARDLCGNQILDVVPVTASARWRGDSTPSTRRQTNSLVDSTQAAQQDARSGTFTFANGNEYVGEFVEDAKEGRGSLQYIDGEL